MMREGEGRSEHALQTPLSHSNQDFQALLSESACKVLPLGGMKSTFKMQEYDCAIDQYLFVLPSFKFLLSH